MIKNNASNELVTIEEMCELLSIGKNAAYKLLGDKRVKAFRIGRIWKIPRASIDEYIQTCGYSF